jgi:hypothetical protein
MPLIASERPSVIVSLDAWYWASLGLHLENVRGLFPTERSPFKGFQRSPYAIPQRLDTRQESLAEAVEGNRDLENVCSRV